MVDKHKVPNSNAFLAVIIIVVLYSPVS